ncbi:MAG: hypothetical protein KGI82_00980 [Betaproteobacteria bacterium]|nr:hypothetical protein [Betaproteobacteria bacterium]
MKTRIFGFFRDMARPNVRIDVRPRADARSPRDAHRYRRARERRLVLPSVSILNR